TSSIGVGETAMARCARRVALNGESYREGTYERPDAYMSLSPDGKSVTAWFQRGSDRFVGMSFTVDGNEPPIQVALPPVGTRAPWTLHFQNHLRTALAIQDGQLHRWSATK